eukprot:3578184-Amphidinium_carterae.1
MDDLKDMTPFDIKRRCSKITWVLGARHALREYCYEEITDPPEGLHYWCYVCGKAPGRWQDVHYAAPCSC